MVKEQDLDLNKGKGAKSGAPGWGKPSRGIQWQRKEYEKETCLRGCVTPPHTHSLIASAGYVGYSRSSQEEPGFPPRAARSLKSCLTTSVS